MRASTWVAIGVVFLLGCEKQPDAAAPVVAAASAKATAPAPAAASAASAAPVATAPSAAPAASAVTADPPPSEETVFWQALALIYDSLLPECKGGWTGDGEITIKDGKIARFAIDEHTRPQRVIPALKGKAAPSIPGSLKKMFEKPVAISVCTGGHRPPAE